ncbi:unnamed protein product, partial [Prunus brigantina]
GGLSKFRRPEKLQIAGQDFQIEKHTKFERNGCRNHPNKLLQVMGKTGDFSAISGYHRQRWRR